MTPRVVSAGGFVAVIGGTPILIESSTFVVKTNAWRCWRLHQIGFSGPVAGWWRRGEVSVVRGGGAIEKIDGLFFRSGRVVRIGGWGNYWFYEGGIIIGRA